MLRFKILASSLPLLLVAAFAEHGWSPAPHACIATGDVTVQLAASPWTATRRVAFTDDAAQASVRVQIVDDAMTADFAVVDDAESDDDGSCAASPDTQGVAIVTPEHAAGAPLIYLSRDDGADYHIFVRSRRMTARDVAALLVGAGNGHPRVAAAL